MDKGVCREVKPEGSLMAKFRFGRTEIGFEATIEKIIIEKLFFQIENIS